MEGGWGTLVPSVRPPTPDDEIDAMKIRKDLLIYEAGDYDGSDFGCGCLEKIVFFGSRRADGV